MMEDGDNKREVKRAFGKNVMEAYSNCMQLMQYSFLSAYKEGKGSNVFMETPKSVLNNQLIKMLFDTLANLQQQ